MLQPELVSVAEIEFAQWQEVEKGTAKNVDTATSRKNIQNRHPLHKRYAPPHTGSFRMIPNSF